MRPHDLGGRVGFGPVPIADDEIFAADWERRAFAVTQFAQVVSRFNTDAFRHGIEREDATVYARALYFDKWIRNGERMLVEGGVLAPDAVTAAIDGSEPRGLVERTTDATPPASPGARRSIPTQPVFGPGDRVRALALPVDEGHTRLPGYVAAQTGTIERVNDGWVLPDSHAHGTGESPAWVYAVAFEAADLWPTDNVDHIVHVDLFEPYLQPA